jgi:PAS domain S-box-containing protein
MSKGKRGGKVPAHRIKKAPWPLLFIFLFLVTAIAVSGYFYYQQQKKAVIRNQINQLQAIAELKCAEIEQWLAERLGDAGMIAGSPALLSELVSYASAPAPGARLESIRTWMASLRENYHYQNVLLFDASREIVLALSEEHPGIGAAGQDILEAARRRKDAVISDLHLSPVVPFPHLDIALPLRDGIRIAGFVLLRIDPNVYLFPRIQTWPTPSPSAETLLVERQGDDVLFLNELRHRRGTAMKLRLPIRTPGLPAALAAIGKHGAILGRDYRGVAVWSVSRPIAGTSWFIVAKIDREEIELPFRRSAQAILLVAWLLVFAAALMILFLWQRQNASFRLRQLEAEGQQRALVQHFDYLTRYANDIILLSDKQWNILETNERALVTYGFNREALLKMNLRDLRVPGERSKLAAEYKHAEERLGWIFETVHQKRDGAIFPVEVSARVIDIEGKKYFQSIVRDISERKQAETALRDNEAFVRSILDNLPIGIAVNAINPTVTFDYMNDRFPVIYRTTRERLAGADSFWSAVYEEPGFREEMRKRVLADCASNDPERMVWEDIPITRRGEEPFYVSARNVPIISKSLMISLVWDVTEHKRAEMALRESEDKFKYVFEAANVGKSITLPGGEINVNQAFCDMLGYRKEELRSKNWQELTPGDEVAVVQNRLETLLKGEKDATRFDKKYIHKNGSLVWGDVSVALRRDAAGTPLHFITTIVDITVRKLAEEKLRLALEHIRQIIDSNIVGVVIADAAGRIIEANDYYLGILGYAREEFEQGQVNWRAITPPEWLPLDEKAIAELRERGTCAPYEKEYLRRDGARVPVYLADALLAGPEEQIVAIVLDMTERKRAEEALRTSERRLRETQEMARLGHWQWDVKTGKVEWSPEVYRIFQLDPESFAPQIDSILALSPWPEDHQRDTELIHRAMKTHEQGTYEQRFLRPDNSIGYYHSTFQGIYDAGGDLVSIIGTVLDISERKRAEIDLQALSSRNQAMLEAIPDIIMEVDPNKVYTWANHAGIEFFGTDVIGKGASYYFEGEQQTYQTVQRIFNGEEEVIYIESWQRRRDDEKRLLAWWCRVLKDADGRVVGALSSARDITEIKRAEIEIRQLNEELENRVQQRTAQLQAANKELEAFSYSVSHDLRAPLRAIDGFSRIVLEEYAPKLDDEGRRLLGVITANTAKMGQLIDDLLAFSRLSRQQMALTSVDLAALAESIVADLKNLEKGRKIEFKAGKLPATRGDPAMLRQVLHNLLANAVKFTRTRPKARIALSGRVANGETVYQVKDNGVGFDMAYVDKLFGVFQRLHDHTEFEGTGVGLAIVQRIILRHGGRIWAESSTKGATFYFSLPADPDKGSRVEGLGVREEGKDIAERDWGK